MGQDQYLWGTGRPVQQQVLFPHSFFFIPNAADTAGGVLLAGPATGPTVVGSIRWDLRC
jgi:hypothetical protein